MDNPESAEKLIERLGHEARTAATRLSFDQRAELIRAVVSGVRDGVKFDATLGGAPEGREWELERLTPIHTAAEDHYHETLSAKAARATD